MTLSDGTMPLIPFGHANRSDISTSSHFLSPTVLFPGKDAQGPLTNGTRAYAQAGSVNRRLMIYAAMIALILIPSTRIVQLPDKEIVRRGNFVIAGTVDGFLCYGTKVPRSVKCHRAVELTQIGESGMRTGRSDQGEDLPQKQPISR
jgi:hypothetical protein